MHCLIGHDAVRVDLRHADEDGAVIEAVILALKAADFISAFDGPWTKEALESALEEYIRSNEWPMGKVMNALRLTLAGSASGLGIADIVSRIGKTETLRRIVFASEKLG
jgi:glutamyl-tRNA synthetase